MNKTWGRATAVLAAGTLMLAGCGDDGEPTTPTPSGSMTSSSGPASPRSSGSTSPSPSATPSSSTSAGGSVPAAARARTEAGAIAFLNFYFDEVNRGQTSPGSVDLFTISEKGCIACKNLQGSLQEYVDNGWSVKQAPVKVLDPAVASDVMGDKVILNFTYQQLPVAYYTGAVESGKLKASKGKRAAAIRWVAGAWEMYGMEKV